MKNKNIFIVPFLGKKNKDLNSNLLLISIAVGAGIGYYFLKKYAFRKPENKAINNIGKSVSDVRKEIKNATENLLGDLKHRNDPTEINIPEAGTLNWRKNRQKSIFPPIPDPNIRIN